MKQKAYLPQTFTRRFYAVMALLLGFTVTSAAFPMVSTDAVQLQSRTIQMSDSAPSNAGTGVGSGKNVVYKVSFTTTNTSSNIGGIVIDFCTDSPIAGDACAAPTAMNTNRATTGIANATGMGTGAFAVTTADGTAGTNLNRIILTRSAAAPLTSTVSFDLGNGTTTGFTNPSTTGTFYARIYTYATQAAANAHVTANPTSYVDYGGIALSTTAAISITARVQENIQFCLSGVLPSANCGGTTTPALTLGEGSPAALSSSTVSNGNVYSQIATNASSGATVRIRNSNSCGGLSRNGGSSCDIPPANGGNATTPGLTAGNAGFGLAIGAASGTVVSAPYNGVVGSNGFGMDSTSGTSVTTTFGSTAFTTNSLPVNSTNNTWTFGATASNVTPSGIYTANIIAIATGIF